MTSLDDSFSHVAGLERRFIEAAYFRDAYRVPLRNARAGMTEIFHAIFAHHPLWMKSVLILRNLLVRCVGLGGASASDILHPQYRRRYAVGDRLGVWPILALTDTALVVGRDDKHLDFRLTLLKRTEEGAAHVLISTSCVVHNRFGKIYLFFVVPFHGWGVRKIIGNAIRAGRI